MGTTLTGYPGAGTDNSQWNQGIGSLAAGLFPNPAAVAQAGYYGAEARRAQLQSLAAMQEINAGSRAIRMSPGQQQPGPQQVQFMQPSGPNMPPIIAPPSDLPMVGGQQQQPPPPQPSLGQTVAGAAAQAPTQPTQPTQPVQAPAQAPPSPQGGPGGPPAVAPPSAAPGGAPPPPLGMPNPATLADVLAPGNSPNPKGWGTTATPAVASSPSPGAPPAPNTTTSNGQVPTDDQGSGSFHQGTVMSPDGGQKFAPPAGPNGSPAPINFDLGTYAALQAAAGRNPEMAKVQLISYIQDAENRGIIPKGTAERMTANYGSSVYGTDVGAQTALAQTGMTVAGGIKQAQIGADASRDVANIGQTGANFRFGQTPLATQGVGPGGTPTVQYPGQTPQGAPVFNQGMAVLDNQPVEVADANGRITTTTFKNARDNNLQLTPKSLDQIHALALQAGMQGNVQPATGAGAAAIAMTPATPFATQDQADAHDRVKKMIEGQFAPTEDPFRRNLAAQLNPNAESDVMVRAQELFNQRGPTYHNADTATSTALQQLQATGHIPTKLSYQSLFSGGRYIGGDERVRQQVMPNGRATSQYVVPQLKPYLPGALTPAPMGAQEGQTTTMGGRQVFVHNGFYYPMQTSTAPSLSGTVAPQQ
jgi:hypothetical protein